MPRYLVKTKITSSDPANTSFRVYKNAQASKILLEYYDDGRAVKTKQIKTSKSKTVWHSFTDKATYQEIRSRLDAIGDYKRNDITIEIVSEGDEDDS